MAWCKASDKTLVAEKKKNYDYQIKVYFEAYKCIKCLYACPRYETLVSEFDHQIWGPTTIWTELTTDSTAITLLEWVIMKRHWWYITVSKIRKNIHTSDVQVTFEL